MGGDQEKEGRAHHTLQGLCHVFIVNFLRIHPESESSRRWERRINKIGCSGPTNKSRKIPALNLVLDGDHFCHVITVFSAFCFNGLEPFLLSLLYRGIFSLGPLTP